MKLTVRRADEEFPWSMDLSNEDLGNIMYALKFVGREAPCARQREVMLVLRANIEMEIPGYLS